MDRAAGHRKTSRRPFLSLCSLARTGTGPRRTQEKRLPPFSELSCLTWCPGCRRHGKGRGRGPRMRFHCGALAVENELRPSSSHLTRRQTQASKIFGKLHSQQGTFRVEAGNCLEKETQRGRHSEVAKLKSPEVFATNQEDPKGKVSCSVGWQVRTPRGRKGQKGAAPGLPVGGASRGAGRPEQSGQQMQIPS